MIKISSRTFGKTKWTIKHMILRFIVYITTGVSLSMPHKFALIYKHIKMTTMYVLLYFVTFLQVRNGKS